jgi:hypothetical protein
MPVRAVRATHSHGCADNHPSFRHHLFDFWWKEIEPGGKNTQTSLEALGVLTRQAACQKLYIIDILLT